MGARGVISATALGLGAMLAVAAPATAAECPGVDQHSLNRCAQDEFRAADRALNLQYEATVKAVSDGDPAARKLLVTAQKAWIVFRDAHCDAVAFVNQGGSMEPMTRFGCLAATTRARTVQLKQLAEDYGG